MRPQRKVTGRDKSCPAQGSVEQTDHRARQSAGNTVQNSFPKLFIPRTLVPCDSCSRRDRLITFLQDKVRDECDLREAWE
jgi:hypothetical protein